ncbi:MAG: Asp-tRNA(Asn)/Glu-tRNA(Gln) amidotransferase subunit GatC [Bacteroidetes bacterium]|jgi:aspartyl-tRNA(Asn)/glutamyl-tRNA(Gln) amidotransferase subunit C|nr:Asp-tRNA(Asn)/Glu-tRNA(Gln) amidotransferase subunit GatC [Bacteroidota bacterium]MBP7257142.1 Asp-tRNA(Asn)/Glu-tRNA(Gln) amidotransferase subunit GatC [Chitinophagales bacterium]MBK7640909.1 Asp-tRNA(Asn)/Glu-tRNA(Gln) amidotransferase subunit GatC [Bacteroidota bacterium]MBK8674348.1 Asp-tRNA(Asn)/Glu-tRNA(Gln) amidotransferase subunit GatC [Bacteroidota bacterium]MBK9355397.1 Asp-tRNA(Asn)/Glu-tRNA(Gln) amidotransferase subunit GatC [Bacteroidota bacterium]
MKVDIELIDNLATLSKLSFKADQKEEIRQDLEKMLNFMEQLNAIDTNGVEPLIYVNEEVNVWRNDEVKQLITKEEALSNAPIKNEDYFMVPKFVNKV